MIKILKNNLELIQGSLFNSKEKYIVHQTNCITKKAAHLAYDVFKHFPYADIYSGRTSPDKPGTIIVKGNGVDKRFVVNMLGQYYPGFPKFPNSNLDGSLIREKYFHQCLLALAKISDLESIAFPYRIGCGAAGGDWHRYLGNIINFSNYIKRNNAKVYLYCFTEQDYENAKMDCESF